MQFKHPISKVKGETLVETLAAILMCTLAIVMLTTAILTASRLNQTATDQDEDLYTQQTDAETLNKNSTLNVTDGTVTIEENATDTNTTTANVTFYGGSDITSYEASE